MKIIVCSSEYPPHGSGIANVAYNVVENLKKLGFDCSVCSPTGPDIYLGNMKLIQKYGRLGLLYYWYKVHKFFKNNTTYDIAWLHQPLLLLKNPFKKSITTVHVTTLGHMRATKKLGYSRFQKAYYFISSHIEKYCMNKIKFTTQFVTDSPQVSLELLDIIGQDANVLYIPNGVDTNRFKPTSERREIRLRLNIHENSKVFISMGRLSPQKNIFTMLDVFSKMQKKIDNCLLIIGGKGELHSKINEYILEKEISNVEVRGYIPEEMLNEIYASADYYITTSEYEGLPLTLLEAMSSGVPCIVSDIPNFSIIQDANCGLIMNWLDVDQDADYIISYIKNGPNNHGKNARTYAINNLDWNLISKKYVNLFHEINLR